jgi:iron complex transport system permease protein
MQGRNTFRWTILILLLILLFALNLSLGSVSIPPGEIFQILFARQSSNPVWVDIIWDFRMPKALACVLAGSALAAAGLQMQTLFRNALAGPDVLGLSSGASLAVSLIYMSHSTEISFARIQNPWVVSAAASIGCAAVLFIMLLVAGRLRDHVSLLIVGLMVAAATSSVVSVLQYLSKAEDMQVYILWTFGSLGGLNWNELQVVALVLCTGVFLAFTRIKSLNAWLLGDHYAQSLGLDIKKSRIIIILSASILTGAVTAFCGPIAFVGLAVPHLTKLLIKTHNHKILIPAVLIGGASLLLLCDILSQLPGSSYVLPINAITALIGAPVVIWIIMRNKIMRV